MSNRGKRRQLRMNRAWLCVWAGRHGRKRYVWMYSRGEIYRLCERCGVSKPLPGVFEFTVPSKRDMEARGFNKQLALSSKQVRRIRKLEEMHPVMPRSLQQVHLRDLPKAPEPVAIESRRTNRPRPRKLAG